MPLYEFTCGQCGHSFTVLTSWQKKGEASCPRCGSSDLEEVLGGFSSPGCGKSSGGFT
ncbi:MAG: FmdB family zinc ribbon protein [bacterium]